MFLLSFALMAALLIGGKPEKPEAIIVPKLTPPAWNQFPNAQFPLGRDGGIQALSTHRYSASMAKNVSNHRPNYKFAWVHPTNYGERYNKDINGIELYNQSVVVLHETVNSATSAINFFQTPHFDNKQQASYHTLIKLDGTIIYLVPPDKRAFGAANSVFDGPKGPETVKTNPDLPPSVNNFAYHSAFETPLDGRNKAKTHSGYTNAQYHSLAWLIAQSSIPDARITTHRAIDRSGQRIDPRSFDFDKFSTLLHFYRLAIY